ncbi:N-acetylmuramoyl-L-alanine amidase [bacterium]|nr:N-acetylmuramoyl-L-alanine amidase [bacterium]
MSFFQNQAIAADSLKVNSINFDNSDSIIFLGTSGKEDLSEVNIKKMILTDPDRIIFDIENAVITFPNSNYELKNSKLKQVKIAQNSVEPDVVRIVISNAPNYNQAQIKVLKIKHNIIIKLNNETPIQQYLTQIYKETKESAIEYYEKAVAISEEKPITTESDEIFNKVQQAFKADDQELVRPNIEQKQARLKSRFFLDKVSPRNGNLLISGIGVINVEKPFTLTNPSRIVFDLPNTIVLQELRDKEFRLSETETVKIGQFEPSKARIVIKTENINAYRPIYSTNLQTLLLAKSSNVTGVNITPTRSELTYFKEQNVNDRTDVINIMFSNPIVYSIKRTEGNINLVFYNLTGFDTDAFNALALKNKTGYEAKQLGTNIYSMSFPIKNNILADCYETLNATQLRFVFTKQEDKITTVTPVKPSLDIDVKQPVQNKKQDNTTKKQTETKKENPFINLMERQKKNQKNTKDNKTLPPEIERIRNKVIIIDPGHGGNDTGALRNGVLEKDLTLQIATKVRNNLREKGLTNVIMTRTTDTTLTLEDRVVTSNSRNADIFVSIHINASVKSEIKGIETHYYTDSGYEVAKVLHKELMSNVNALDRGLFKSKFYVINHTEAPAVLLELGFISNEAERNALTSEQRQNDSAKAIADGIVKYLSIYRSTTNE